MAMTTVTMPANRTSGTTTESYKVQLLGYDVDVGSRSLLAFYLFMTLFVRLVL